MKKVSMPTRAGRFQARREMFEAELQNQPANHMIGAFVFAEIAQLNGI
jgi:hypothetical protein